MTDQESPFARIDAKLASLGGWRGEVLARMRRLIREADPTGLFNAGFGGGTRRAIDIREGERIDATAFKALIKEGAAYNVAKQKRKRV